jgi:hypothetical protein
MEQKKNTREFGGWLFLQLQAHLVLPFIHIGSGLLLFFLFGHFLCKSNGSYLS